MPGLTVTEKEHWKDRIGRRIDKRIEMIAAEQPNLMDRIHREARLLALQSLGLADLQAEKDKIEQDRTALERRERLVEKAMLAKVRGVAIEDVDDRFGYGLETEISNSITRRQTVHEDALLAGDDFGKRILMLRQEKENLLDTVWLATSPAQLKTLWAKVAELLGDEQTQLQKDAMAIAPVED